MTHPAFGARRWEPAFALCAVVMLLLSSCTATPPPPTSTPGAAIPSASPDPSPTAVAVAVPATIPSFGPLPDGGYEAFPTGALTGEWAYTVDVSDQAARLWAVPLDGRPAKLAVRFRGAAGNLGLQFAHGKRVLLVVDTPRPSGGSRASLLLVELETGRTSLLGRDDGDSDRSPAWSPDGQYVAYRRELDRRTTRWSISAQEYRSGSAAATWRTSTNDPSPRAWQLPDSRASSWNRPVACRATSASAMAAETSPSFAASRCRVASPRLGTCAGIRERTRSCTSATM